jgi:uncharacterized LabA/DUF88 family protein
VPISILLLIDGENFKAKIKDIFKGARKKVPNWNFYDFKKLINSAITDQKIDKIIFYGAKIKRHEATPEKSDKLIAEQRMFKTSLERQGFEFKFGGTVRGHITETIDKKNVLIFKEKGVDVQIAVDMVSWTCDGGVTNLILGSSDSDLIPAIKEIRKRNTSCTYLGFEEKPNLGVLYASNKAILIRNSEVLGCEKQDTLPI